MSTNKNATKTSTTKATTLTTLTIKLCNEPTLNKVQGVTIVYHFIPVRNAIQIKGILKYNKIRVVVQSEAGAQLRLGGKTQQTAAPSIPSRSSRSFYCFLMDIAYGRGGTGQYPLQSF